MWNKLIENLPPLEALETASLNRHRVESFKTARRLHFYRDPEDVNELKAFMEEYARQLVGPEIYDILIEAYNKEQKEPITDERAEALYLTVRKYTTGV